MKEGERLATAILWRNGHVTALNGSGDQIPDLQGRFVAAGERVVEAADRDTEFVVASWRERTNGRYVTASEWLREGESLSLAIPGPPL